METDVLIIGGGPSASTVGSLLRRYNPNLEVTIIEREKFPRDHIGESQLPAITGVLEEMGVWDKVEAAGFPIKIGSTYRWGVTNELWNLNFLMGEELRDMPRPSKLEGQRRFVAFHVDRSIYDEILLDHAASVGCKVFEQTKAVKVNVEGGRIQGVEVSRSADGMPEERFTIKSRYYVDASGSSGILRRALDIKVEYPTRLKNVAFWDYWRDAEWAETVGCGGTRVQIMSMGWGWIWFIPVTTTRTSIGLVTHAEYYKSSGKSPEELYSEAIASEPRIRDLVKNATREQRLSSTKDWSYIADQVVGDNWILVGDACGFADPILSAGLTLAHVSARKGAYTILELERGEHPGAWLKDEYNNRHRFNILQHHRFAEFWYSANGCFTELTEYCSEIAKDAGIDLGPEAAFLWMSTGGFTAGNLPDVRGTGFGLAGMTGITGQICGTTGTWKVTETNVFTLHLEDVTEETVAFYGNGRVTTLRCYKRGEKLLPLTPVNEMVVNALRRETDGLCLFERFVAFFKENADPVHNPRSLLFYGLEALEGLVLDGWVTAELDPTRPLMPFKTPKMISDAPPKTQILMGQSSPTG